MDCPSCSFSTVERKGTTHARLFQCRHDDSQYMIARSAFEAFISLDQQLQLGALHAARQRTGQAVPVIDIADVAMAQAWRGPFIETGSVRVVHAESARAPKPHNDV